MIYLTACYCIFTAFAVAIDLVPGLLLAACCVAVLSAAAFNAGRAFKLAATYGTPAQRTGRCVMGVLLMLLAAWLSSYPLHVLLYAIPGVVWVIFSAAIGFIATPEGHALPRARMH